MGEVEKERIKCRFKYLDDLEYELRGWWVDEEESYKVDALVKCIRRYKTFLSHQMDYEKREDAKRNNN